jgi:ATP-dependent exoDNAse (exonuclease V) beta subunit
LTPTFEIINASAGSGKTFALAERVLTKILKSQDDDYFKRILALTFTNKAAQEMKERVLYSLKEFSIPENNKNPSPLFNEVKKRLNFSNEEINRKSKTRLTKILHNFSFFQIDTLDSFSHHIIRSFANELNYSSDFNVTIDNQDIIEEAVSQVFNNNNKDQNNLLIDFAVKKISEGKSWDVEHDLKEFAEAIFNENQFKDVEDSSSTSYKGYNKLKIDLENKKQNELRKKTEILQKIDVFFKAQKFEIMFTRNAFPKFLDKVNENDFTWKAVSSIESLFLKGALIKKACYDKTPSQAMEFVTKTEGLFLDLKTVLVNISTINSFENSVTPTALLKTIKTHFKDIQKEKNQISISEFNEIINREITNQPISFLYEKLGIRFNNYFIDEFQDTSSMQWTNIVPLISHALESDNHDESGSLLIVGDPKQSVYRWRGADPNIFISLMGTTNPFNVAKSSNGLPKNYRSKKEIVKFNNKLFSSVAGLFMNSNYNRIYKLGSNQVENEKQGGHVTIKFLSPELKKSEELEEVLKTTIDRVKCCNGRGFKYSEIAILTRDNKQASLISARLIEKRIPIECFDSLSIGNSEKVKILINVIKLRQNPRNKISKFEIANYYYSNVSNGDQYLFFKNIIELELANFFKKLGAEGVENSFNMELVDSIDYCIKRLKMDEDNSNPFLAFFKEILYNQVYNKNCNENEFLLFWDKNKDKLFVPSQDTNNSVKILTIHKSKGLEYPVVIYPFVDSVTYRKRGLKKWLPIDENQDSTKLLMPFNENLKEYNRYFKNEYENTLVNQELDNVNLLYVALTRAIDELHMIPVYPKLGAIDSHSQMLRFFLQSDKKWSDKNFNYIWGEKTVKKKIKRIVMEKVNKFHTQTLSIKPEIRFTNQKIKFGNAFHDFMSRILYVSDYKKEAEIFMKLNFIDLEVKKQILSVSKQLINHPNIKKHFLSNNSVVCEKEIFVDNGKPIRPDRIVFNENKQIVIIDYKTGERSNKDENQIKKYRQILSKMGYKVNKTVLIYVSANNNDIDIVSNK